MPRGGRRERAGRKSAWVNSETQLIRVPKIFVSRLIEIAKHLDQGHEVQLIQVEFPLDDSGQLSIFSLDDPLPQSLGLRALAKRLCVSSSTLSTHKGYGNEKLLVWTYQQELKRKELNQKYGWFYSPDIGKYLPLHPSEFDHLLSQQIDEEDYEDF